MLGRSLLDYFAGHGYPAHAVDLRGHGTSEGREKLRWTRIADYVDDVTVAAQQLSSPPILVGHSMGGFIIQKYLETHAAPAAVLLSSPSPAGLLPTAVRIARRHPVAFARTTVTCSLLPIVASPQLAREAFFSRELPDGELASYWRRMQDDSYRSFLDMVALDLPRPRKVKTPLLVLACPAITCCPREKSKRQRERMLRYPKSLLMLHTIACSNYGGRRLLSGF